MKLRSIFAALFTATFVTFLFWCAGFDFDRRGELMFLWAFSVTALSGVAVSFVQAVY